MPAQVGPVASPAAATAPEFCRIEGRGPGQSTVTYVERQLRTNGVLKALNQAKWLL
jgi:hypothetical protein